MSQRVKDILVELKTRLETTGYTVFVGAEFSDPETDPLPHLAVFFGQDGEKSLEGDLNSMSYSLQKEELHLVVEGHAKVDPTQPLLDLEDLHTEVKDAVFKDGKFSDGQNVVLTRRRSWPHSQYNHIAYFQIELRIPFREKY